MPMIASTSGDNPDNFEETYVEQLCDLCIESKHIKIVKHKKITPTNPKLQEIYPDFWGLYNPPSLSEKTYVALLLDEYTCKSWIFLL